MYTIDIMKIDMGPLMYHLNVYYLICNIIVAIAESEQFQS